LLRPLVAGDVERGCVSPTIGQVGADRMQMGRSLNLHTNAQHAMPRTGATSGQRNLTWRSWWGTAVPPARG
jgi:hypothetical protein